MYPHSCNDVLQWAWSIDVFRTEFSNDEIKSDFFSSIPLY